ncbi:MFS transporter [Candidatus Hodarchaeum mangrovi]
MKSLLSSFKRNYHSFIPVKYPEFGKLFYGQFISNIGSQFSYMALNLLIFELVYNLTESTEFSTLAMAILAISTAIPMIIVGPWAGVVIDRINRKYSMVGANIAQAIAIGVIPFTNYFNIEVQIWLIFILSFLNSSFARFFFPARGASIPKLIDDKNDLFAANALSAGAYQVSALIGPFLAGIIVGLIGYDLPFFIDAMSFLISAIFILGIRTSLYIEKKSQNTPFSDLKDGGKFIISFPPIFYLLIVFSILMFAGGASMILIIPYLQSEMGLVESEPRAFVYGLMIALSAAVGMLFAFYLSRKKHISRPIQMITFSAVLAGIMLLGFSLSPNIFILAIFWIGFGTIEVSISVPLQTITQETVPDNLRGKIFSFINLSITFSQIIGMGVVSIFASSFLKLRGSLLLNGVILLLFSLLGYYVMHKFHLEDLTEVKRLEYYNKEDY